MTIAIGLISGLGFATLIAWGFRAGGRYRSIASLALALLLLGAFVAPTYELKQSWDTYKSFAERNQTTPTGERPTYKAHDCAG